MNPLPLDEWSDAPRFGEPDPGFPLARRPSAYAIVFDDAGRIAVVVSVDGAFLPGGGLDAGETFEEGLRREAREECGWELGACRIVDRAVQFAVAANGSVCYEKRSLFFDASIARVNGPPTEPGHDTLWLIPSEAAARLRHESHGWAVLRQAERRA